MSNQFTNEPMLDMFLFETSQMVEQLEQVMLGCEKEGTCTKEAINEIFRIMHTIKGSSAMMMYQNISTLAHKMEDLFYFLREKKPEKVDFGKISDYVFEGVDFIKVEMEKIKNGDLLDGDASQLIDEISVFLDDLKAENNMQGQGEKKKNEGKASQQYYISKGKTEVAAYQHAYKVIIFFESDCGMENIRAYTVVHNLKDMTEEYFHIPEDIIDDDTSSEKIQNEGFQLFLKGNESIEQMEEFFSQVLFQKEIKIFEMDVLEYDEMKKGQLKPEENNEIKKPDISSLSDFGKPQKETEKGIHSAVQSIISVSVAKLDKLMDLVGEMVIAEAMVTQNPDLLGLELDNFQKAAQQLNKITSEMQDTVMAIRMVPIAPTFQKMHRIVRDMCKQLKKDVDLKILGEETEVDKNIIEHISDPLMHLVRNSLDHGIEPASEREEKGKSASGTLTLEAKNSGSDVQIIVRDDGKGLDKARILKKAKENNLLFKKPEEMSDKEIFQLILLPGFSTKEKVSEYSGRGVGMDVVMRNVETIGGSLLVDSVPDKGTTITLTIPLTLAIIDGMNVKVGGFVIQSQ